MRIVVLAGLAGLLLGAAGLWTYRSYFPETVRVAAAAETHEVPDDGDAADDPAIWIDRDDPSRSLILGTNKEGGLAVYDLDGRQLQYVDRVEVNNVDVRDGFLLDGEEVSIVAAGDKRRQQIVLYRVDADARRLVEVPYGRIHLDVDPEGLTMYRSPVDGRHHVFVVGEDYLSGENGWLEQWALRPGETVPIEARCMRRLRVGEESEGMVADDRTGELFVAEEVTGIWRYSAEPDGGEERTLIDRVGFRQNLKYNVEGLAIHTSHDGRRHLVASSQGSNDFVVYRLGEGGRDAEVVGRFAVDGTDRIDAVTHTDGIDLAGADLGPRFPGGVFVCQDDEQDGNQNFKLVRWVEISRGLGLPGR